MTNKDLEHTKLVDAYDSLLSRTTTKLGFIRGELETYKNRSRKEQKKSAWITVELIQKIMDGEY